MGNPNDVIIRYRGVDDFSDVNQDAIKSVNKLDEANKKAEASVGRMAKAQANLGKSIVVANQGMELAGRLIGTVGSALEQTVGASMEYNKSIRDLAQNLAITTEETSRIIQTADDFTVSQEAVTTALQMAVKKGMKPSIDTLAKMADEYNSIADPTARAARLTEVFGRNWASLTPLLKEGGQAIRDAAASQSDALIVTEEQSKATRELEQNLDALGDSVEGLKLKIGNALTPAISKSTDVLSKFVDIVTGSEDELSRLNREMQYAIALSGENSESVANYKRQIAETEKELQNISDQERERNRLLAISEQETRAATAAYMGSKDGLLALSAATREANTAYQDLESTTWTLNDATQKLTKEFIFQKAAEGLSKEAAVQLGIAMGTIDAKIPPLLDSLERLKHKYDTNKDGAIDAGESARGYARAVLALGQNIDKLQSKTVTITTVFHEQRSTVPEGHTQPLQGGAQHGANFVVPPGFPNDSYRLGVTSGEHVTVIPNSTTNVNTTVNAGGITNIDALAAAVSTRIARQLRARTNSGSGYRQ